jgi:hypothetical protein
MELTGYQKIHFRDTIIFLALNVSYFYFYLLNFLSHIFTANDLSQMSQYVFMTLFHSWTIVSSK